MRDGLNKASSAGAADDDADGLHQQKVADPPPPPPLPDQASPETAPEQQQHRPSPTSGSDGNPSASLPSTSAAAPPERARHCIVGFLSPTGDAGTHQPARKPRSELLQETRTSLKKCRQPVDERQVSSSGSSGCRKAELGARNDSVQLKASAGSGRKGINHWHYKQTGIKSRPIKLIEHPIEHIERKIILTYLLGILFKIFAILTGPLIVLTILLLTMPFIGLRRLVWYLMNLSCTLDARIRTVPDVAWLKLTSNYDNLELHKNNKLYKQIHWHYCPFNYLETYWFKESLINTVTMMIEHTDHSSFPIDKLRAVVGKNLLARPAFRKFLSRPVMRGLPLYKSLYWHHLGLQDDDDDDDVHAQVVAGNSCTSNLNLEDLNRLQFIDSNGGESLDGGRDHRKAIEGDCSPSSQFSSTATTSAQEESVRITLEPPQRPPVATPDAKLNLGDHIFADPTLGDGASKAELRRYLSKLVDSSLANGSGPLWEMRVVAATCGRASYLIFRCHQSLADGSSLSKILTNELTSTEPLDQQIQTETILEPSTGDGQIAEPEVECEEEEEEEVEDDETELRPLGEKLSFVERISRANSIWSATIVGPLTVLLWVIWTFTRRKNNHLNKRPTTSVGDVAGKAEEEEDAERRFYMTSYSLTKIHQIKQMTRSTVSDVILCALSGALRDYLRNFNGVTNPPNLNVSLAVDMRRPAPLKQKRQTHYTGQQQPPIAGKTTPQVNYTLINVPLPTSVEGTVPRLWELRNTMAELRSSVDPWVMLGFQRFLFHVMPVAWYQWLVNTVALRNSSTLVSSIRGPQNMVEGWCVDLLQRAIYESQQPPRTIQTDPEAIQMSETLLHAREADLDGRDAVEKRSRLLENLGSIAEIHYCMQPPSGQIPISFNCISYHNKLFVTSLSRSLLVEDSKLLVRLFFRQLDQLTNTIAKRRSLVTIVRTPVPIEISCQPASPLAPTSAQTLIAAAILNSSGAVTTAADGTNFPLVSDTRLEETSCSQTRTADTVYRHKDDLEANLMNFNARTNRCTTCQQSVCTCKRRKSLFSFDHCHHHHHQQHHHQHRQQNFLSLLIPVHLKGSRSGGSSKGDNHLTSTTTTGDCTCAQQLLEELDEERADDVDGGGKLQATEGDAESTRSRSPSDDGSRGQHSRRPSCSKCYRQGTKRSTLSLNEELRKDRGTSSPVDDAARDSSRHSARLSKSGSKRTTYSSAQLSVPGGVGFNSRQHSKSETDLLPAIASHLDEMVVDNRRKSSWFNKGRLSMFVRGSTNQQRSFSSRASAAGFQEAAPLRSRSRHMIEMSANTDMSGRHYGQQQSKRRRQSVATTTGASHIHWSVVIKDKINNDVSLRYQLDSPLLGIRNRRFSTIGNAVIGTQRRASLLPFGLIHNQSLPKLFWDGDGEAHL